MVMGMDITTSLHIWWDLLTQLCNRGDLGNIKTTKELGEKRVRRETAWELYTFYLTPDPTANGKLWWKSMAPERMLEMVEQMIVFFERSGKRDRKRLNRCYEVKQELEAKCQQ